MSSRFAWDERSAERIAESVQFTESREGRRARRPPDDTVIPPTSRRPFHIGKVNRPGDSDPDTAAADPINNGELGQVDIYEPDEDGIDQPTGQCVLALNRFFQQVFHGEWVLVTRINDRWEIIQALHEFAH